MNSSIRNIFNLVVIVMIAIPLITMIVGTLQADECIIINGETIEKNSNSRPFVCFEHDLHNEKAAIENCDRCHHAYDEDGKRLDGESSEDKPCFECHASNKGSGNSGDSDEVDIELAVQYHKLCRDCHLTEKKGAVVCGKCHVRK